MLIVSSCSFDFSRSIPCPVNADIGSVVYCLFMFSAGGVCVLLISVLFMQIMSFVS